MKRLLQIISLALLLALILPLATTGMVPLLSLVAVLLLMVFVFVLFTKIGGLQTAIESLKLAK